LLVASPPQAAIQKTTTKLAALVGKDQAKRLWMVLHTNTNVMQRLPPFSEIAGTVKALTNVQNLVLIATNA
jgi:hypothetical protein